MGTAKNLKKTQKKNQKKTIRLSKLVYEISI